MNANNNTCTICRESFQKATQLNKHMSSIHGQKTTYNCLKCHYFSPSIRSLSNHMHKEHPKGVGKETSTISALNTELFMEEQSEISEEEYEEMQLIEELISKENNGK